MRGTGGSRPKCVEGGLTEKMIFEPCGLQENSLGKGPGVGAFLISSVSGEK